MRSLIKEKKKIARGTVKVTFDLLGREVRFKPGQYFFVTLINPPFLDSRGAIRHFSIVNPPTQKGVLTMATREGVSAFKRSLMEMPEGSSVEVDNISGNFVLPDYSSSRLVFLTGGIGITPFMSMLQLIENQKLPYQVTVIYSNKDRASTAFLDELKMMARNNPRIRLILTMTGDPRWKGEKGRIDADFLRRHLPNLPNHLFYISGPAAMVEALKQVLKDAQIPSANIKSESFSGY